MSGYRKEVMFNKIFGTRGMVYEMHKACGRTSSQNLTFILKCPVAVVLHTYNPDTQEAETEISSEAWMITWPT